MADPHQGWTPVQETSAPSGWTPVAEPKQPSGIVSRIIAGVTAPTRAILANPTGMGQGGLVDTPEVREAVANRTPFNWRDSFKNSPLSNALSKTAEDLKQLNPISKRFETGDTAGGVAETSANLGLLWSGIGKPATDAIADAVPASVKAKAGAVGKVAAKDAASHIPVLGRFIRRPSWNDYIDALKAQPAAPNETAAAAEPLEGEYVDTPAKPSQPQQVPQPIRADIVRPPQLPASASAPKEMPYRIGPGQVAPEQVGAPQPPNFVINRVRGLISDGIQNNKELVRQEIAARKSVEPEFVSDGEILQYITQPKTGLDLKNAQTNARSAAADQLLKDLKDWRFIRELQDSVNHTEGPTNAQQNAMQQFFKGVPEDWQGNPILKAPNPAEAAAQPESFIGPEKYPLQTPSGDLTEILKQSLEMAQKARRPKSK